MAEPAARLGGRRFDVAVVGAGHNGLVAAVYGPAGLRTAVVERREIVGGACTTEEFAPGFHASPGAYVLSLLRPAVWRDFALRARGLEVLEAAPTLNVFRDGARLTLHDDDRETAPSTSWSLNVSVPRSKASRVVMVIATSFGSAWRSQRSRGRPPAPASSDRYPDGPAPR